jgi:hypothetical protein
MKKIHLLIFQFAILWSAIYSVHAQDIYDWDDPQPVSDSVSFNSNPAGVLLSYSEFGIFYEKRSCDTCDAGIWFRNFTTMAPEKSVLIGNASYTHPHFLELYNNNFIGYLICFIQIQNTMNIMAYKLDNDLNVTNTYPLTNSDTYKSDLNLYSDNLGWMEDESAFLSQINIGVDTIFLAENLVLDSGNIETFRLSEEAAYFQKWEGDSLHIFARLKKYQIGSGNYWDELMAIDSTGNCLDLNVANQTFFYFADPIWVKNDQIFTYSQHSNPSINQYNTKQLTDIKHPSLVLWDWMVAKDFGQPHVLVYSTGLDEQSEIYSSLGDYGYEFDTLAITRNNVTDKNPEVFWGEVTHPESNWVYAVWESERNQHQPLYFSKTKAYVGSGINEISPENPLVMQVMPNPFSTQMTIQIKAFKNSPIMLSVCSLSGKSVWNKTINYQNQETQTIVWQPQQGTPKGVYIIVIEQDGLKVSQQAIYK